jgi:hypothetical protein
VNYLLRLDEVNETQDVCLYSIIEDTPPVVDSDSFVTNEAKAVAGIEVAYHANGCQVNVTRNDDVGNGIGCDAHLILCVLMTLNKHQGENELQCDSFYDDDFGKIEHPLEIV